MHIMYWLVFSGNMIGATCYWGLIIARRFNERRESEAHYYGTGAPASPVVRTTKAPAVSHAGAYSGVIRGWRTYSLWNNKLLGGNAQSWDSASMKAECLLEGPPKHPAPDKNCRCGIYVMKNRDDASGEYGGVLCEVVAWGEVIECCPHGTLCTDAQCVTGWRAEHVRIERIHITESDDYYTTAILRGKYGVEVVADLPEPQPVGAGGMLVPGTLVQAYQYLQTQPAYYMNRLAQNHPHYSGIYCGICGVQF